MSKDYYKILGVDWGEKRIGLAIGDSETKIAVPLKIVSGLDEIEQVIQEEGINLIVVGQPFKLRGKKFKMQDEFLKFINLLKEKIKIPVKAIDERLSSQAADALAGEKKTKAPRDAIAAMLILQTYLDKHTQ